MLCARPYCKNGEDRINGYCSGYCQDLHELQVEAEIHLTEVKRLRGALEKIARGEWRADGWEAYSNLKAIASQVLAQTQESER